MEAVKVTNPSLLHFLSLTLETNGQATRSECLELVQNLTSGSGNR